MSTEPTPTQPAAPTSAPSGAHADPPQRSAAMSTWAIVVVMLTLAVSIWAGSNAQNAADLAGQAAASSESSDFSTGLASDQEVQALCRLLGAVAAKQGIDIPAVFNGTQTATACQSVAQEATARP